MPPENPSQDASTGSCSRYKNCRSCNPPQRRFEISSSVLQERLRTEHGIGNGDSLKNHQIARSIHLDLQDITGEIAMLNAQLIALNNEASALQRRSAVCSSLTSPIRRLPMEVLLEIFVNACSVNFVMCLDHTSRASIPALAIGAVCVHWNSVIRSTKRIWTTISLDVMGNDRTAAKAIATILQKSGDLPLDIRIKDDGDNGLWHPAAELLLAQSSRWISASFEVDFSKVVSGSFSVLKSLSLLQEVSFTWSNPIHEVDASWPKLPHSPELRMVATNGGPVMPTFVSLGQLADLRIGCTPILHILQALRYTAPSLLACTIKFEDYSWDEEPWPPGPPGSTRVHTSAQYLALEAYDIKSEPYMRFFGWVHAPCLTRLDIMAPDTWETWGEVEDETVEYCNHFGEHFIEFLECSAKNLTTLRLVGDLKISEFNLLRALALTPVLQCLVYHEMVPVEDERYILSNHFFNSLNLNHPISTAAPFARPLPLLIELDLRFSTEDVEHRTILNMIQSRWMMPAIESDVVPLRRVDIMLTDREVDSEESTTMARLQQSGLRVRIVGPPPAAANTSGGMHVDED